MKYYSETLKQLFDTEEELEKEEAKYLNTEEAPEENECCDGVCDECNRESCNSIDSEKQEKSLTKKDLADAVAKSEDELKEAYELYSVAEQKVSELSKAYLEEVNKILDPAKKRVKEAEQAKYEAIKKFNDAYGAYRKVYTGKKAAEEFNRALKSFDNLFDKSPIGKLFNEMFWF